MTEVRRLRLRSTRSVAWPFQKAVRIASMAVCFRKKVSDVMFSKRRRWFLNFRIAAAVRRFASQYVFLMLLVMEATIVPNNVGYARDIWFAPAASVPPSPLPRSVDYMQLFSRDAPWKTVANKVQVFQMSASFVLNAPDSVLKIIFADLKRRGKKVALAEGVLNKAPDPRPACGGWGLVEGYSTARAAQAIANKIKRDGGTVDLLAIDEPLWFGHYFGGYRGKQRGCLASVSDVFDQSVDIIGIYADEFPFIGIGIVEPTATFVQPTAVEDVSLWVKLFRNRFRRPLDFLHIDVVWPEGQPEATKISKSIADSLIADGLIRRFGIIYNGLNSADTDSNWVTSGLNNSHNLEKNIKLCNADIIFQSWVSHPKYALPETDPTTFSGFVKTYLAQDDRNEDCRRQMNR